MIKKYILQIYESVILIGIDIPQLSKKFINSAFTYLEKNNQIIGPSTDGGFYLIGSKSNIKNLSPEFDQEFHFGRLLSLPLPGSPL